MNNKKIKTTLKDGSVLEYDVILTFKNEVNNKNYIVYTDNEKDKYGKLKIYVSIYDPDTLKILGNPNTKEELEVINELLDKVLNEE